MEKDIRMLHIIDSSRIVGDVKGFDDNKITIENPMILIFQPNGRIIFAPYLQFSEDTLLELDFKHIISIMKCKKGVIELYNNTAEQYKKSESDIIIAKTINDASANQILNFQKNLKS